MASQLWQLQPGARFIRTSKVLINNSEAVLTNRFMNFEQQPVWGYRVLSIDHTYSIRESTLLERIAAGTWRLAYDPAIAVAEGL